jgi:hypothetical protein
LNFALASLLLVNFTAHDNFFPVQAPLQPKNLDPGAGVAVRRTVVFFVKA